MTDAERSRLARIVANSRTRPGTFAFAHWFGVQGSGKALDRVFIVGGQVCPLRAYSSQDRFGRSFKARSLLVCEADHSLSDADLVALVSERIDQHIASKGN